MVLFSARLRVGGVVMSLGRVRHEVWVVTVPMKLAVASGWKVGDVLECELRGSGIFLPALENKTRGLELYREKVRRLISADNEKVKGVGSNNEVTLTSTGEMCAKTESERSGSEGGGLVEEENEEVDEKFSEIKKLNDG